jgi:hypothetical protein
MRCMFNVVAMATVMPIPVLAADITFEEIRRRTVSPQVKLDDIFGDDQRSATH